MFDYLRRVFYRLPTRLDYLATAILLIGFSGLLWYLYLTDRVADEQAFTTIQGIFQSAETGGAYPNGFLDIYLEDREFRFRVDQNCYGDLFDPEKFFAHVRPGTELAIVVEKAELEEPNRPPFDSRETVFVFGLSDAQTTYYSLGDWEEWSGRNRVYLLILAIVVSLVTVLALWGWYMGPPGTELKGKSEDREVS